MTSQGLAGLYQKRIKTVRQAQAKKAARTYEASWGRLKVSPSCPPSTVLQVRGGLMHSITQGEFALTEYGRYWPQSERCHTIPDLTVDVAEHYTRLMYDGAGDYYADDSYIVSFDNAGWYKDYILLLNLPTVAEPTGPDDWTFRLEGTEEEFETAAEAEAHVIYETLNNQRPWRDGDAVLPDLDFKGFPLCGLILKNTGVVGTGQILAVDKVNRGRSYVWPADVRPRWLIEQ